MITYFQAIVIGVIQGVTELFPISSLGHSVLLPTLFGWHNLAAAQSDSESFFLAFLVGLHVATALALLWFYRQQWRQIIGGFFNSIKRRQITTSGERLAWLIIIATIPAGLFGLAFERSLRLVFAKPLAAAIFLMINGLILLLGDRLAKAAKARAASKGHSATETVTNLSRVGYGDAAIIGTAQTLALFAGISRSGITMVGGLWRGLDHEDAARFSFLLATPIILAAGVIKLPDLAGSLGDGVRGQVLVGSLAAGLAAYLSVRFLDRFFRTNSLRPFGIYCLVFGLVMTIVIH